MRRILLLGPTSAPVGDGDGVADDLARLARPGIDVEYRTTGAGPTHVRSAADAAAAAPHVVRAVRRASSDGFDAVIVDCTEDPGLDDARRVVTMPVIGAGEALREAMAAAPAPVRYLDGDELRAAGPAIAIDGATRTVALGATGWSHVAAQLRLDRPDLVVLDPLDVALDAGIAALDTDGG